MPTLETALIFGDPHRPYHDKRAWRLMLKVAKALKPKHLVCLGDMADFYCVTPETRILTADLNWVPAGDLELGEKLIANKDNTWEVVQSEVTHTGRITRPVYKITLEDGTQLRASADHPWLCATSLSKNRKWKTVEEIAKAFARGRRNLLLRATPTWEQAPDTAEVGYISGIFDGEGHISLRTGMQLAFSQKPGLVAEKVKAIFARLAVPTRSCLLASGVEQTFIVRHYGDKLKFLGTFRPARLLHKFHEHLRGKPWANRPKAYALVRIANVEFEGPQEVVALSTSTETYIAEGFIAHNSVSSHSKSPERINRLAWEVEDVNTGLDELDALKATNKIFIAGNHEDRLRRYLEAKAPELFGIVEIPQLLNLPKRGWSYVGYKDYTKLGRVYLTHDIGSSGANAVPKALAAFQTSVITAHTHRQQYMVISDTMDKPKLGCSLGWLGDAKKTDYMYRVVAQRDWTLGFGVATLRPKSGLLSVTPVSIVDYGCSVWGSWYDEKG